MTYRVLVLMTVKEKLKGGFWGREYEHSITVFEQTETETPDNFDVEAFFLNHPGLPELYEVKQTLVVPIAPLRTIEKPMSKVV